MTGKEFAREFSNFMNNMSDEPRNEALQILLNQHRTLQQTTMAFCLDFIKGMADKKLDRDTDLRNEASVEIAQKIIEHTGYQKRALPFI